MTEPIDSIEYWRERIARAQHHGSMWLSVYECQDWRWKNIQECHEKLIRKITNGKLTLDAGCGYGRASQWVDFYTGIDFSPDFIEVASGLYPNKEFMVGRLDDLPFKDQLYDCVICVSIKGMIIRNLGQPTWDRMESEMLRVSKELFILEYGTPDEAVRVVR